MEYTKVTVKTMRTTTALWKHEETTYKEPVLTSLKLSRTLLKTTPGSTCSSKEQRDQLGLAHERLSNQGWSHRWNKKNIDILKEK